MGSLGAFLGCFWPIFGLFWAIFAYKSVKMSENEQNG